MCGRYSLFQTESLPGRFKTAANLDLFANYNIAPGATMPVVTRQSSNSLELMRWGLVPFWAKDPKIGYRMINARAEGIEAKPAFREALKKRRCLVPVNGFFEWKQKDGHKQPFYIHLKEEPLFSFAGLYESWKDAEGKELRTYTIITTQSNRIMQTMHDRMPVILSRESERWWLDSQKSVEELLPILKPYDGLDLEAYLVSEAVNKPGNSRKELIEKVG